MSHVFFSGLAERFRELEQPLNALDAATGDGDHGAAMRRGLEAAATADAGAAAKAFRGAAGGASGTLFGALVGGLEAALAGEKDLPSALAHAAGQIAKLGMAKRGDKTMLDALIPAAEAAGAAAERRRSAGGGRSRSARGRGDNRDGGTARAGAIRRERRNRTWGRRCKVRGGNPLGVREGSRGWTDEEARQRTRPDRRRHDRRLRGGIPRDWWRAGRIRGLSAAPCPHPRTERPRS